VHQQQKRSVSPAAGGGAGGRGCGRGGGPELYNVYGGGGGYGATPPGHPGGAPVAHAESQAATDRRFVHLGPELRADAPATHCFSHERIDPTLTKFTPAEMRIVQEIYYRMAYLDRKFAKYTPSIACIGQEVRLAMRECRFTRKDAAVSTEVSPLALFTLFHSLTVRPFHRTCTTDFASSPRRVK
jgi:hypothetical protein